MIKSLIVPNNHHATISTQSQPAMTATSGQSFTAYGRISSQSTMVTWSTESCLIDCPSSLEVKAAVFVCDLIGEFICKQSAFCVASVGSQWRSDAVVVRTAASDSRLCHRSKWHLWRYSGHTETAGQVWPLLTSVVITLAGRWFGGNCQQSALIPRGVTKAGWLILRPQRWLTRVPRIPPRDLVLGGIQTSFAVLAVKIKSYEML